MVSHQPFLPLPSMVESLVDRQDINSRMDTWVEVHHMVTSRDQVAQGCNQGQLCNLLNRKDLILTRCQVL